MRQGLDNTRRIAFLILTAIFVFYHPSLNIAADELVWEKRLPFENATITYAISGMEEGTETLYLRQFGRERAAYRETVIKMMGKETTNSSVILKNSDFIFSYDLLKRQGVKIVNPQKIMHDEFNKLSAAEQETVRQRVKKVDTASGAGLEMAVMANAETFLGHNCDKVETPGGTTSYVIHGSDVPLHTEMSIMGNSLTVIATSVHQGTIDDRYFQHPPDIIAETNVQSNEIARNMAMQAISLLKDPNGQNTPSHNLQKTVPIEEELRFIRENEELLQ